MKWYVAIVVPVVVCVPMAAEPIDVDEDAEPPRARLLDFMRAKMHENQGDTGGTLEPPLHRQKTGGRLRNCPDLTLYEKMLVVAACGRVLENRDLKTHKWNYQVWCQPLERAIWSHQVPIYLVKAI